MLVNRLSLVALIRTGLLLSLVLLLFFGLKSESQAGRLIMISDKISTSQPSASSTHEIQFILNSNLPAGGKITIKPEAGFFVIPGGLNYNDVEFFAAPDQYSPFVQRSLDFMVGDSADAVLPVGGGNISIAINTSVGIAAGSVVRIRLGNVSGNRLINPALVGSYKISVKTFNSYNDNVNTVTPLDFNEAWIAIVNPISMSARSPKFRYNGAPTGVLLANTVMTLMSLTTNYDAVCKYSTSTGISYNSMVNGFGSTDNRYHSTIITGLENGFYYHFYVRCRDIETSEINTDDYEIAFSLERGGGAGGTGGGSGGGTGTATGTGSGTGGPDGGSGDGNGSGSGASGSGGSGGGGGGGGGGTGGGSGGASAAGGGGGGTGGGTGAGTGDGSTNKLPYPPDPNKPILNMSGWAAPNAEVIILKDGLQIKRAVSDAAAQFSLVINDLNECVYTFILYDFDTDKKKSANYSATFALKQNSQTNLTKIIIPPTIGVAKKNLNPGDNINVTGQTVPGMSIEAWLEPISKMTLTGLEAKKNQASAGSDGKWNLSVPTAGLAKGVYNIKARVMLKDVGFSNFSESNSIGLGEAAGSSGTCQGADLNHDGKVNLTDFSILLFHWNTDNACADQNHDGKVNIVDFSIMMYHWTG